MVRCRPESIVRRGRSAGALGRHLARGALPDRAASVHAAPLERRVRLGSGFSKEPLEIGLRSYTGTVVTDFEDLTNYNLFVNGTEAAIAR